MKNPEANNKYTLLHLDDDRDFLDLFKLQFKSFFDIVAFDYYTDAKKYLEENHVDVIITDFEMPGMDGLDFLKYIKTEYPEIPVIFYTGQGNEEIAREAFISGASDYYIKDIFGFAHNEILRNSIVKAIEKRLTEQALQEWEDKFRLISDQSLMGILIYQEDIFKYANNAVAELVGYSPEEIMSWEPFGFSRVIHPDDYPFVAEQGRIKQEGLEGAVVNYKYRLINRKGEIVWVEQFSRTVKYRGKNADFITMINIDERVKAEEELKKYQTNLETKVSERTEELRRAHRKLEEKYRQQIHTENLLREKEEKYRALFDSMPDAVFLLDDETIIDCNHSALEMFGYEKKEDILGLTPTDLSPEYQPGRGVSTKQFAQDIKEIHTEKSFRFEWLHRRRDGSLFPTEIALSRIGLENKTLIQGIMRDISEKKKYQDSLEELVEQRSRELIETNKKLQKEIEERKISDENMRRSEEKFRLLFENFPESLVIVSNSGVILECNKATETLFGYSREEIINKSFVKNRYLQIRDVPWAFKTLYRLITGQNAEPKELEVTAKGGGKRIVEVFPWPIKKDGKTTGIQVLIRDITATRSAKIALDESEKKYRLLADNI